MEEPSVQKALEWLKPLEKDPSLPSSTAYLFQRTHEFLGNDKLAEEWKSRRAKKREREVHDAAIKQLLLEQPKSFGAGVVRAHHFYTEGNVLQAKMMFEKLSASAPDDKFVEDCLAAINDKSKPFPSLDDLPINTQFVE